MIKKLLLITLTFCLPILNAQTLKGTLYKVDQFGEKLQEEGPCSVVIDTHFTEGTIDGEMINYQLKQFSFMNFMFSSELRKPDINIDSAVRAKYDMTFVDWEYNFNYEFGSDHTYNYKSGKIEYSINFEKTLSYDDLKQSPVVKSVSIVSRKSFNGYFGGPSINWAYLCEIKSN